jgi:hypothetical protein
MRAYAVAQAADAVITNVAVHAALAAQDDAPTRETRRARARSFWRRLRRSDTPQLSQPQRRFAQPGC